MATIHRAAKASSQRSRPAPGRDGQVKPFCAVDAERSDDSYDAVVARWLDEGLLIDRGEGLVTRSITDSIIHPTRVRRGRSWVRPTAAGALTLVIALSAYMLIPQGEERVDTSSGQHAAGSTSTTSEGSAALDALDFRGITPIRPSPLTPNPRPAGTSPPLTTGTSARAVSPQTSTAGPTATSAVTSRAASPAPPPTAAVTTTTTVPPPAETSQAPAAVVASSTVSPTPTAASAVTPSCGGGHWELVVEDHFDGTNLDTAVWESLDGTGHNGNGVRRPTAIWVANGTLNITAKMQDGQLVSGGLIHRHDQTYGRYEVRVRTDVDLTGVMSGAVFTRPQTSEENLNHIYRAIDDPADANTWHTITMEWTPDSITIHQDGKLVEPAGDIGSDIDSVGALAADVDHHAAIRFDALGSTIPYDLTMQVDYIRIDSYQPC